MADIRPIDANALIKEIVNTSSAAAYTAWETGTHTLTETLNRLAERQNEIINMIEAAPTIIPVDCRPHGRWIRHGPNPESMRTFHELGICRAMGKTNVFWTCSCCANWGIVLRNYCSNFSAMIDEEADNGD